MRNPKLFEPEGRENFADGDLRRLIPPHTDITLRDLFAAFALSGLVREHALWRLAAEQAYAFADALLEQREASHIADALLEERAAMDLVIDADLAEKGTL